MKNQSLTDVKNDALTRRQWMGASVIGAGLIGSSTAPASTEGDLSPAAARGRSGGRRIIDGHVHLWKLPRTQPPISDDATYPPSTTPWLYVDRLMPDYDARVGGPKVDKVVLIESSVGVLPDKILLSNHWMLNAAAADRKIMSVVGKLDPTLLPGTFVQQVDELAADKNWVGIRIGSGIFVPSMPRTFSNLQPNVLKNLSLMAQRGLMIDANGLTGSVLSQIGAATGITIVMDHFAGKPTTFDLEESWKTDMQDAARYANLNIKVSDVHKLSATAVTGSPAGLIQYQPIASPTPYLRTLEFLWRTFGEDRLIFGTNWPVSDAGGIYVDSIDLEISILESFLAEQYTEGRDKVMYKNALRVYSPRK